MAKAGFRPFQYLSSALNSALERKSKRTAAVTGQDEGQMSLFEHIQELRQHIVRAAIWLVAASGLSFLFMGYIIGFLRQPYDAFVEHTKKLGIVHDLTSIGVFEVMTVNFKICFLVGFAVSLPFTVREVWRFIRPALYDAERRIGLTALVSSIFLFYAGLCFGYFLIIPYFFRGALGWASRYASVMITYESYFNALVTMMLIFAAIFEVPVVLSLLGLANVLPSSVLSKNRKVVFLVSFLVGAVLAPPDVLSMCLVSVPLYLMVEASIFIIRYIEKGREARENQTAEIASPASSNSKKTDETPKEENKSEKKDDERTD